MNHACVPKAFQGKATRNVLRENLDVHSFCANLASSKKKKIK